jgi:hypothetical protein
MDKNSSVEWFDANARELCRYFAEGNRPGVLDILSSASNRYEAALIGFMAAKMMPDGVSKTFVEFLVSLNHLLNKDA